MVVASGDVHLPRFVRPQAGAEVDRLYRRYAGEVLAYALRVMRSRPDAEDIVQTVFVRALGAIERGEKVRAPRNWLIKIAHNECRRLISSRKVHAELPEEVAVEPSEAVDVAQLRTAMAALAEAQCQALVLRELEGRTYAEIASTLGLTVSAVETLIFRARRALREQLEGSMSCADFALLLDDASARSRVRAHARICAGCATLERQARGRKGALKRIASMLGLPWWGAKIAAVGLTAGVVVAVGAVPQHGARTPIPRSGTIAPSVATPRPVQPVAVAPVPAVPHRLPAPSARTRVRATTPAPPLPDPPQPGEPPLPPAAVAPPPPAASAAPAAAPRPTPAPAPAPAVSLPVEAAPVPIVTTPVVEPPSLPAVALPVTVEIPPVAAVSAPAAPVEVPNVSLP